MLAWREFSMTDKFYYSKKMMDEDLKSIYNMIGRENFIPDQIIGMSRGGLVPAVCLSHALQIPMTVIEWGRSTRKINQTVCEFVSGRKLNFLIVDDIVDTGETLTDLFQDWENWCEFDDSYVDCNRIRVASMINYKPNHVLYENLSGSIFCNYYGRTMAERPWITFWWEIMNVN